MGSEELPSRVALHPVHLGSWFVLGAVGTAFDKIHAVAGVTVYPDPQWIGERLPVSPAYVAAGVCSFILYVLMVGLPRGPRGPLGGRPIDPGRAAASLGAFLAAYALTSILSGKGREQGPLPWVCAAALLAWALPSLLRDRDPRFWAYALAVSVIGPSFEWAAVAGGGFAYGICPSTACAGAPVAIVWLPLLYLHYALLVRRLLAEPIGSALAQTTVRSEPGRLYSAPCEPWLSSPHCSSFRAASLRRGLSGPGRRPQGPFLPGPPSPRRPRPTRRSRRPRRPR
jgi:hypothetical protein